MSCGNVQCLFTILKINRLNRRHIISNISILNISLNIFILVICMEKVDEDYMGKISSKLKQLGLPNKPENRMFCMIFNELRELNNNIEVLLSKLKEE